MASSLNYLTVILRLRRPRISLQNPLDGRFFRASCARLATQESTESSLLPEMRCALKKAMKERDLMRRDVLKSVIGDIQTSQHLANAPSAVKILKLAVIKRLEAAKTFTAANPPRTDLEELYTAEAEILKSFLPAGMATISSEELVVIVKQVIDQLGLLTEERPQALGKVVKAVRDIAGERVEGKEIARVAKQILESKNNDTSS